MKSESLFEYMDGYLGTAGHPDYPTALNGVQVSGPTEIHSVCAAVDASVETIEEAVEVGADLLIVHHGLFWGGLTPLTGRSYSRVAPLIKNEVALYSSHLPLDAHPEVGNCALLASAIGVDPDDRFGEYEGVPLGWTAPFDGNLKELEERVGVAVNGPVNVISGGSDTIGRVGIVTGGGGSFVHAAALAGIDALITGEGSHHTYVDAVELGVNILYAGHYATETFGVRALADHLAQRFGLSAHFLDFPSGL